MCYKCRCPALVIERDPAIVDGRVDGDGRCVAIAVAVVLAAAVTRGPLIDAAFAPAALGDREGCPGCRQVRLAS